MPPLKTARWELMAQGLAQGKTAEAAYEFAGYKPHRGNASRMSANESIQARKAEILEKAAQRTGVTVEWITDRLRTNVERAMQFERATNAEGKEIGDFRYDGAVANKALELLGKHKGMFKENVNLTVEISLADLVNASYGAAPKVIEGKTDKKD